MLNYFVILSIFSSIEFFVKIIIIILKELNEIFFYLEKMAVVFVFSILFSKDLSFPLFSLDFGKFHWCSIFIFVLMAENCIHSLQQLIQILNHLYPIFPINYFQSVGKSEGWEAFKQCLKQEMKSKM